MADLKKLTVQLGLDKAQYSAGLKGASSEAQKSTGLIQGSFNNMAKSLLAIAAPAAVFGAISKFAIDGVKEFVAYNKTVRETSEATGTTAEEVSRLIQVGDDWGVTSGEITGAMKMMTKNGMQPSIDSLADLADEFVNTADKTAFAEKAAKLLGRNWSSLIPILKDGGQALRDQTAAVSDGLLATDESIAKARKYEVAMDNLGDVTTELKYILATELLPTLIAVANVMATLGGATMGLSSAAKAGKITWKEYLEQSAKVTWTSYTAADAQKWLTSKLKEEAEATIKSSDANKDARDRIAELTTSVKDMKPPADDLAVSYSDLARAAKDAALMSADLRYAIIDVGKAALGKEALEALTLAYDKGEIEADQYRAMTANVMTQWLGMPASEVNAGLALQDAKEAVEDGLGTWMSYYDIVKGTSSELNSMNGKKFTTYFELVTTGTNYHYVPQAGSPGMPAAPAPSTPVGSNRPKEHGGAHGLDMIVPSGYPNDSYPVRATSGERVTITPAGEKGAGITIEGSVIMQITTPVANGEQLYREFKRRLTEDLRTERLRA